MKQSRTRIKWVFELIDPVTRTWNEELIRKILLPHDVDEVLKIRLPQSTSEDFIAWHFERSGVFSVRSAYRLAVNDKEANRDLGQSSTAPTGERKIWSVLWKANVPPKIRNFGWRLATESLGVQTSRHKRGLELFPTCSICGMEPEDGYHAVMRCTKAKALRDTMREVWNLPRDTDLTCTGHEWVLLTLDKANEEERTHLLFIWWRAWHLRNNIIFGDGKDTIKASAEFLQSYASSYAAIRAGQSLPDFKGKGKVMPDISFRETKQRVADYQWARPNSGWLKLNVDASFIQETNHGAWGAVLRDTNGAVIGSAWNTITNCASAEAAEAEACLEGIRDTMQFIDRPVVIESDRVNVIQQISSKDFNRSPIGSLCREIQSLLGQLPDFTIAKISRNGNRVAHALASFGRSGVSKGVLIGSVPACVLRLVDDDCNEPMLII